MKLIDLDNWERREHFNFFRGMDYPHFNITANLDITAFYPFIKEKGYPFFLSFLYLVTKTSHEIKEFRYRIRGDLVVEHEAIRPSFTVMTDQKVFGFCTVDYVEDFKMFLGAAIQKMEAAKQRADLTDEPDRDDLIYVTSIPWVSFTSISHTVHMHPVDSIPRIAWGKYFEEQDRIKLPFSLQSHHALTDGEHVGRYFNLIQSMLDHPADNL